jgi:hypothetical protein
MSERPQVQVLINPGLIFLRTFSTLFSNNLRNTKPMYPNTGFEPLLSSKPPWLTIILIISIPLWITEPIPHHHQGQKGQEAQKGHNWKTGHIVITREEVN